MPRVAGIFSAAIVVAQLVCTGAWAASATEPSPPVIQPSPPAIEPLPPVTEAPPRPLPHRIGRESDAGAKFARHVSFVRHVRPHAALNPEPQLSPDEALTPDAEEDTQDAGEAPEIRPGQRRQVRNVSEEGHRVSRRRSFIASHPGLGHRAHGHEHVAVARPEPDDEPLSELPPGTLSDQEQSVTEIASQNGDQTYLMVDKSLGRILLFEDGKPVFMGRALTGESYSDRMPEKELRETFTGKAPLNEKVTPAGRFTVTRGYDPDYGPLFDINEIKGKDWGIAIHKVYLGIPAEHRAARLASPSDDDKNITFGCINITPAAVEVLLRELPETGSTPLYVLPRDETETASFFAAGSSLVSNSH